MSYKSHDGAGIQSDHDEMIVPSHRWGGQPPWRKVRTLLLNEAETGREAQYRHDLGGCKPNRPEPVSRASMVW
jgi:hypothetical protein